MECANVRYLMTFLAFGAALCSYLMRSSLSVTIVAMTGENSTSHNDTNGTTPAPHEHKGAIVPLSNYQQGLALGAYFWGYTAPQVPGGMLVDRVGARIVLAVSLFTGGVMCLVSPIAATQSWISLTVVRVLLGVTQYKVSMGDGFHQSKNHDLWPSVSWVMPSRISCKELRTSMVSGTPIGTAISFLIAGVMCEELGWESVFYAIGGFSVVYSIIWLVFTASEPRLHRNISQAELQYIKVAQETRGECITDRPPTPWKAILTSIPVWSLVVAHITNNWVLYLALTCLPMFMKDVVGFDIKSNGFYSALPNLVNAVALILLSVFCDYALKNNWIRRSFLRKGNQVISGVGWAVCSIVAAYVANDNGSGTALAVFFITLTGVFSAFQYVGFICVYQDMAAQYAGSVFGLSNFPANIPGMIVPSIVTAMTVNKSRQEWLNVFYLQAGVAIFGALQFAVFASTDVQPWARATAKDRSSTEDTTTPYESLQEPEVY